MFVSSSEEWERASSVCNCSCFNQREGAAGGRHCISLFAFFSLVSVSCVRVFKGVTMWIGGCGRGDMAGLRRRPQGIHLQMYSFFVVKCYKISYFITFSW